MMETVQKFVLPDGRLLGFSIVGEGMPVLYFHGTASSRLETLLLKDFVSVYGFQVIGVDRPGYGLSTFGSGVSMILMPISVRFLSRLAINLSTSLIL